ncbi:hypothetical protein CCR75_000971 [Bremia lactucae]|uniref:ATP-dependent RNA helicase n=1 Tax=Bremia lactucae TaxID=4779 RepID=A0A976FLG5_BRELC|nr:hypothetical protein CCR75_000971 [Bremia lactucae]
MDGFSLNISASSGTRAPVKRKNTFRAKQQAKRAKIKAKKGLKVPQKPLNQSSKGPSHLDQPHNGLTPRQVEVPSPQLPSNKGMAQTNSVEPLRQHEPILKPEKSLAEKEPKIEVKSASEVTEKQELEPNVDKIKTFGTRRNPNKDNYSVEKFTQPTVQLANVLSKPLTSSSSKKIFAQHTFESMQLATNLVHVLQKDVEKGGFGFKQPTNVQVQTIPSVLQRTDILIKSETGSGKTLSYLLPIVQQLQQVSPRIQRQDGCMALVLAPTRELCTQILETATKLIQPCVYLVPGAIIGGEKKKAEKARLRKGLTIVIATPGRLADHLVNTQSFNYSRLQFLVLDEADRLLDMGFEKQITQIVTILNSQRVPQKRQNILVSATVNSGVQQLAKMSLCNPVLIDADAVTSTDESPVTLIKPEKPDTFSIPHQLMQHFMLVPAKTRLCALTCFLREELCYAPRPNTPNCPNPCKIVVFLSTCDAVDFHCALFRKCVWPSIEESSKMPEHHGEASVFGHQGPVFRLHGNIPQHERVTTFKSFCASKSGVLLCTDVAARGLNLPTVKWIVQYDPPTETRDYVHRVGRTARSGNQGSSLLFLLPSESDYLMYLSNQGLQLNALSLEKTIARVGKHGGFVTSRKKLLHEIVQSDLQFRFEQMLLVDKGLFELACQAFHSFMRSYATHSSDTRNIFHVRSLHFGHVAKSFALRDPPASSKLRDTGLNSKKGSLQKRKERFAKQQAVVAQKQKKVRDEKRRYAHNVSEFAN